ncbi:acyltransferase family protein [Streptomyces sp. NBC_00280]|uniref:acyltransferase family protein n=1 Tax=Streptomyces sp. NBC_00280 TaxID=2975699 RepID=UPI00324A338A
MPHAARVFPGTTARQDGRLPSDGRRLDSLTGLRFPAALLVFFSHTALLSLRLFDDEQVAMDYFRATSFAGALGVTFFFVLSGFVLTWSAREQDTARAFWRRRFVKIYPNYVVTWALALLLFASSITPVRVALANLFMVQSWVPSPEYISSVNPPSWSLGCEALFYASFPVVHRLLRRVRAEHLKYGLIAALTAVVLTPLLAYALMPDTPTIVGGEAFGVRGTVEQYWVDYILPPVRMVDFVLGILLALVVRSGRWRGIGVTAAGLLLAGSYVLCSYVPFLYALRVVTIVPIVLLVAAAATADVAGRRTVLNSRVVVFLGEISFAFYLVHYIVIACGREVLNGYFSTVETVGLMMAELVVAVMLSWALYALVERPITRRWSTSRRPRHATG